MYHCLICINHSHALLPWQTYRPSLWTEWVRDPYWKHYCTISQHISHSICTSGHYETCILYLISCFVPNMFCQSRKYVESTTDKAHFYIKNLIIYCQCSNVFGFAYRDVCFLFVCFYIDVFLTHRSYHVLRIKVCVNLPTRVVVNHIFKALESEARRDVVPTVVQSEDTIVLYDPVLHWERIQTWGCNTHRTIIKLSSMTPSCSSQENKCIMVSGHFLFFQNPRTSITFDLLILKMLGSCKSRSNLNVNHVL